VVTPTDPQTISIQAFHDQLVRVDQWSNVDYRVYSAANDTVNLDELAKYAVSDNPNAIVACGWMAASKVLNLTTSIPVVMAAGGEALQKPKNFTGYTLECADVSKHHVQRLNAQRITVLYDDTNDPSLDTLNSLYKVVPSGKSIIPLPISDPSEFAKQDIKTDGFMLLPNAMYYLYCEDIAEMVDDNDYVTAVYYPEHEYKDAHKKNRGKAKVYGHDIVGTFRDAADIVSNILNGTLTIASLAAVKPARPYQDE
jgi:hypothetical protein